MFLAPYYTERNGAMLVSGEQASEFAKRICRDFNPIHDPGAKRFCVPGDLLFALALMKYGVSQSMHFKFTGMVGDRTELHFPEAANGQLTVTDQSGKSLLEIEREGESSQDPELLKALIKNYVVFSGQNFPSLLMPLMEKNQVMFNPARPLVMYDSMSFSLDSLNFDQLRVSLSDARLEVEGKRADEFIHFDILDGDSVIGKGVKKAVIGGLKPYDAAPLEAFVQDYEARRAAF